MSDVAEDELQRVSKLLADADPWASETSVSAHLERLLNRGVRPLPCAACVSLRPRIERLMVECGFSTPMILRILDPIFAEPPADHGHERAPKKHPDCVALMCGKIDCRYKGPCYVANLPLCGLTTPPSDSGDHPNRKGA